MKESGKFMLKSNGSKVSKKVKNSKESVAFTGFVTLLAAICLTIASVSYIMYTGMQGRAYRKKMARL